MLEFDIARFIATGAALVGAAVSALVGAAGFGAAGFAIGLGGGGLGSSFFFLSSRVTATVIVFLPRPFRSATVIRLAATPRCSAVEMMTVPHRKDYSVCWTLMANLVMPASFARSRMCTTVPCITSLSALTTRLISESAAIAAFILSGIAVSTTGSSFQR